jgi:hypothetical protein
MMQYTTAQALGQARLAEMHHQAQRATLARAARQARRARRQQSGHRAPGVLAAATAWVRRSRPTPESALWHTADILAPLEGPSSVHRRGRPRLWHGVRHCSPRGPERRSRGRCRKAGLAR